MPKNARAADPRLISTQLRDLIARDGRSGHAIARAAGIDAGIVQRFGDRRRGLTLDSLDRIALALGLRLVGATRGRPSKGGGAAGDLVAEGVASPPRTAYPGLDLDGI